MNNNDPCPLFTDTTPPRHILVLLDHSPWSQRVLDTAKALALSLQARLHLLHVHGPESPEEDAWIYAAESQCGPVPTTVEILPENDRPVADIALSHAAQLPPGLTLIVMGTHGASGNPLSLMGHVPHDMVQKSPYPVVLTHRNMSIPGRFNRILVPLDATPTAATVIPVLGDIIQDTPCRLELLHVLGERVAVPMGSLPPPQYMDHVQHEWRAWKHEFIERFAVPRKYLAEDQQEALLTVAHGPVAEAILRFARQRNVDLIALGWSGHLQEGRAEVLKQVLREALCPVLLYHPEPREP